MAVNIGFMHGEAQMLELLGDRVLINGMPEPIKNLSMEEVEAFEAELAKIPVDDTNPGYEALRNAKRINFIISLMDRTFGDDCMHYLEHMIGHLHHDVALYLQDDNKEDD